MRLWTIEASFKDRKSETGLLWKEWTVYAPTKELALRAVEDTFQPKEVPVHMSASEREVFIIAAPTEVHER